MEIEIVNPTSLGNILDDNDPNSLFKTLAHAIHGDINKYIDVRLEIGKHLCKNINTIFDEMTKRNIEDEYKSKSTKGEELDEYICDLIKDGGTQQYGVILYVAQIIYNIKIICYLLLDDSIFWSSTFETMGSHKLPIINIFYDETTKNYFYNKENYLDSKKKNSGRIDVFRFQIDNYRAGSMKFGKLRKSGTIHENIISENENKNMSGNIYEMDRSKDILHTYETNNKYYKMYTGIPTKQSVEYFSDYEKYNFLKKNEIEERIRLCTQKLKLFTDSKIELKGMIEKDQNSYIRKINITSDEKIVIFGDHHGSYHTFFRNMLRLHLAGVINLKEYTVNKNHRLVFLGDIVDRGNLAVEILDLLFRFIINDNMDDPKLIINRGNHEDINYNYTAFVPYPKYGGYGFEDEIFAKFGDRQIFIDINNIFNLLPSAIILHNVDNDEKYWLCHGCIPTVDHFEAIKIFAELNTRLVRLDCACILPINNDLAMQIRWNDKHFEKENGFDPDTGRVKIGTDTIKKYLEIFNFIIRGHEDNIAHASLLGKYTQNYKYPNNFIIGTKATYDNKQIFSINPTKNDETKPQIRKGPIESINTSNEIWAKETDFLKVLTISTNNDKSRELDSDSFIILNFNKKPTVILNNATVIDNKRFIQSWLASMTHDSEKHEVPITVPIIKKKESSFIFFKAKYVTTANNKQKYFKELNAENPDSDKNFESLYLKYKAKYLALKNKLN